MHRSRRRWSFGRHRSDDAEGCGCRGCSLRSVWRHRQGCFWTGCWVDERRKTGWMRAEAAGDPGPWRQQAILGRGRWDADALRDIVRDYVVETLGARRRGTGDRRDRLPQAGQGVLWRGAPVHCVPAGKITNCQIGVFAAYGCSQRGHDLHRPGAVPASRLGRATARDWMRHMFQRRRGSRPSPRLAVQMIERAIAAEVPFTWVAADSVYGVGDVEQALRRAGKGSSSVSAPTITS